MVKYKGDKFKHFFDFLYLCHLKGAKVWRKKEIQKEWDLLEKEIHGYEGRVTIQINGKSKQISIYNKDKRALIQEMIKAKQQSADEIFLEKNRITLEEWLKKWIEIYKKPFVKPRTVQGYIEKIKSNILPHLGNYALQSLDRLILQEFFSNMTTGNEKQGIKKYSPKTIREVKSILNMALRDAEIDKLINVNPMNFIRTPKVIKQKKKATLTLSEQKNLMNILLRETNGLCYIFIMNTGLRPGECCGLKWKHYNYKNSSIKIHDNFGKITYYNKNFERVSSSSEEKELKTPSSYRTIPLQNWLNELLYSYMKKVMKEHGFSKQVEMSERYIFTTSLETAPTTDYLWDTLDKLLKRNNFKHLSVYSLRHLFATRCIDVNIPINQVQQYLGHSLASTTMDFYVEYDEETNKNEMEKLELLNTKDVLPENIR